MRVKFNCSTGTSSATHGAESRHTSDLHTGRPSPFHRNWEEDKDDGYEVVMFTQANPTTITPSKTMEYQNVSSTREHHDVQPSPSLSQPSCSPSSSPHTMPASTEPILVNEAFCSLYGENDLAWMDKAANAYEAVSKNYSALHPGRQAAHQNGIIMDQNRPQHGRAD
jgi:hypothetical protein